MKQLKLLPIILLIINMASCQNEKKQKNLENKNTLKNELNLEGHTFFKVTETDSGKVLLQPCDASIENYKFYKDSLYHNWGQEFDILKKISIKQNENIYILNGFNLNTNENDNIQIEKIKDDNSYLKINNKLFIDSLYVNTIIYKQQSCKECYDGCEDKEKEIKANSINGKWATNSNNPIGITIKENELIICVEPNNYYIHLTKINEKAGDKTLKYKLNRLEGIGSKDVYSESYLNDNEIAIIKILENDKIEFNWLGFYNKVSKERQYTEPIISDENPILLEKCKN